MRQSRIIRNLRLGIKSLLLHKLRSVLTMLGVVFGVASVIGMLAVGEGSKREDIEEFGRLGTNNIIIESRKPSGAVSTASSGQSSIRYGITFEDRRRILQTLPGVERAVPVRRLPKEIQVADGKLAIDLIATTADWFDLIDRAVLAGRTLHPLDQTRRIPVIVLTENLARRLPLEKRGLDKVLNIDGKLFQVVGIIHSEHRLEESGGGTLDADMDAFVPLNTARQLFGDINVQGQFPNVQMEEVDLHELVVQMTDRESVEAAAPVIRRMFERFHDRPDYQISVPLELLRKAERVQGVMNLMLSAIAGISLLVGGIGIMNIMLASVTERTREIGIRRAIGAKRGQIISQFLTEALLLSTLGGVVGLALGTWGLPWGITYLSRQMDQTITTIVPTYAIVLSFGISVLVGVVFGLYPAMRAAKLDPIIALRHE